MRWILHSGSWRPLIFLTVMGWSTLSHANAEPKKAEGEAAPDPKKTYQITDRYIHDWQALPKISGREVGGEGQITIEPRPSYATVVFFIASWCLPCQRLAADITRFQKRYRDYPVTIVYAFTQDTHKDALGFAKHYGLNAQTLLASEDMLKEFHHPELPSIYVADRNGWLLMRKIPMDRQGLAQVDTYLTKHARQ